MTAWQNVLSNSDIKKLLDAYCGFHDSCLVELNYKSGMYVGGKCMCFASPNDRELHMIFHSQWYPEPLELCFSGVRKFNIAGWQEYYFTEILDCYLAFHSDLVSGSNTPLIVWSDFSGFCPYETSNEKLMHEPFLSYVIANTLKWRFISES